MGGGETNAIGLSALTHKRLPGMVTAPRAATVLRWSLGIVYLWFGALKLADRSPAFAIIRNFFPPMAHIPIICILTGFEVVIGILLILGWLRPWIYYAVILHLLGTMSVALVSPWQVFKPFPYLTLVGEFIVKNLVLMAAAVALLGLYARGEDGPQRARVRKRPAATVLLAIVFALAFAHPIYASGHGPMFGLATPTLGKGAGELDLDYVVRGGPFNNASMFSSMFSYGITSNVQLDVAAPFLPHLNSIPGTRLTYMMPGNKQVETDFAWRFQRKPLGVGKRLGTTAFFGLDLPTGPDGLGVRGGPGFYEAIVTGYASRSWYLWGGIGDNQFTTHNGDRRANDLFYSGVWGYRPKFLRGNWHRPDGRLFIEMVGDHLGTSQRAGLVLPQTAGDQIMMGPSTLWLFRNVGIEGGILFPINQDFQPGVPRERYRIGVDVTYIFASFHGLFHP